ncbi:hypothetical protein, partial [Aliarcobacter cryaerophilus]
ANGGQIYLTTNAKDELLKGVVNHSGIIEANSLDELTKSEVILFAHGGKANISGTIDAKGGFVETSAKNLSVTDGAKITTGHWLIDPENITIDAGTGDLTGETVGASVIENTLNGGTNVTLQATNKIYVNHNLAWNQSTLLLIGANGIDVNSILNVTGIGSLNLYTDGGPLVFTMNESKNGFIGKVNFDST